MGRHAFSLQTATDLGTIACWERDGLAAPRPKPKAIITFLDAGLWGGRELKLRIANKQTESAPILDAVFEDAESLLRAAMTHPVWRDKQGNDPVQFLNTLAKTAAPVTPDFSFHGLTQAACRLYGCIALHLHPNGNLETGLKAVLDDPRAFYETVGNVFAKTADSGVPLVEYKLNVATLLSRYAHEVARVSYPDAPPIASIVLWEHAAGLEEESLAIRHEPEEWRIPKDLEHRIEPLVARARLGGKRVYNNKNARLEGWSFSSRTQQLSLTLRPTWYYYHLATNASVDWKVGDEQVPLRDRIARSGRLEPLHASLLSNELGMNAVLETRDNRLLFPQRSGAVVGTENATGPSISGAVAWYHTDKHGVCPFQAIRTQLADELGVFEQDIIDTRLIGLTRGLIWGGHPSLRFIVRTRLSLEEVLARFANGTRDNWEARGPKAFTSMPAGDKRAMESVIRNENAPAPLRAVLIQYLAHRTARENP